MNVLINHFMRKIVSLFLIVLLTVSCSPYKRLARLQRYHPYLFPEKELIIRDTVFIPSINIDTIYKLAPLGQKTPPLEVGRAKISLNKINDSLVHVYINVPPDTVYIEKKVLVPTPVPVEKSTKRKSSTDIMAFTTLILSMILMIFIVHKSSNK